MREADTPFLVCRFLHNVLYSSSVCVCPLLYILFCICPSIPLCSFSCSLQRVRVVLAICRPQPTVLTLFSIHLELLIVGLMVNPKPNINTGTGGDCVFLDLCLLCSKHNAPPVDNSIGLY
ncbi:hypothetical protein BYT27DRAFT_6551025 [Phlegmacium glaucopus]|nr:hypothetical protein BYT27DRAFT_6551025 [Phlegmacium glaucopus]